jgi:glycosyl transferase family 25
MKTYIINLETSTRRRENVLREVQRHGLDYELVTAVDGRQFTADDLEKLPIADVVKKKSDYYSPNIIAAAFSHVRVYERILESGDEAALILEDDAVLCDDFGNVLDGIAAKIKLNEIVICHFMSFRPMELSAIDSETVASGYSLHYPLTLEGVNSGAAYVITRGAAATLLKVVIPVQAEADSWKTFYDQGGFESIRFVYPMPVSVRGDKSTIATDQQWGLRRWLTSAFDDYQVPPFYQILRSARLRSVARRSRISVVDRASEFDRGQDL